MGARSSLNPLPLRAGHGVSAVADEMSVGLDEQADVSPADETAQLVQALMETVWNLQDAVRAAHADLMAARQSLAKTQAELAESRKLLGQDALTGTENRRAMDAILEREISRARRDGEPLAVAMVDLDHFKQINDSHGHAAGDAALVHLTQVAKSMLRGNDAFIRYGGEEFVLVLPKTDLQDAVHAVGRLQTLLEQTSLTYEGKLLVVAFSAGVAALKDGDGQATLLRRADEALHEAKRAGRNRTVTSE